MTLKMHRRWLVICSGVIGLWVVTPALAQRGSGAPEDPHAAAQARSAEERGAALLDDLFLEVAWQVQGFGGMYTDESGALFVYLKDASRKANAERVIEAVFGTGRVPLSGIQVLHGRYGFEELRDWHERLIDVLAIDGVSITDIDEANNRLTVGLERMELRAAVEDELARLGVPLEAVHFEKAERIKFASSLQDKIRPPVGGIEIVFNCNAAGLCNGCTLGFNVARILSGNYGFVTNSHCTIQQGGVESTIYTQGWERIGVETADPTYRTREGKFLTSCPAGRRCRFSDSAFVRFDDQSLGTASRGYIARTTGIGSIEISASNPRFRITSEASTPLSGTTLNKIGATSGWSQGPVVMTCANVTTGTDITLLCQDKVAAKVAGGDSGSPVFRTINSATNDYQLHGILWGETDNFSAFWFSNMSNIQTELGSMLTCSSGC